MGSNRRALTNSVETANAAFLEPRVYLVWPSELVPQDTLGGAVCMLSHPIEIFGYCL